MQCLGHADSYGRTHQMQKDAYGTEPVAGPVGHSMSSTMAGSASSRSPARTPFLQEVLPRLGSFSVGADSNWVPNPRLSDHLQDTPEVAQRAAEWERQIESLDQKEMEIHQTQLRLIREQTATFRGDLLALRQEVLDLRAICAKYAGLHGDLVWKVDNRLNVSDRVLQDLGDTVGKHGLLHQDVDRKLAQLLGSAAEHHRMLSYHASMKERLEHLEKVVGDSASSHYHGMEEAHAKLEQLCGRLSDCEAVRDYVEKHTNELDTIKAVHAKLVSESCGHAQNHGALSTSMESVLKAHASIEDRISYIEKSTGDSLEKHAQEVTVLRAAHSSGTKELFSKQASMENKFEQLHGKIGEEQKERERHIVDLYTHKDHLERGHASMEERLKFIEQEIGDSADRHLKELEQVKGSQAKLASEGNDAKAKHISLEDRLNYIESWFKAFKQP